jgi:hypothetical protein
VCCCNRGDNVDLKQRKAITGVEGHYQNPQASTWQVLVNLIQNAFFRAILPGFERGLGRASR